KILDEIKLSVRKQEHVGILGSSGGGKSTLLKIIAGLYEITEGTCIVSGCQDLDSIRKQVAVVMQNTSLFPMSIRDNITCGHSMSEERISKAVEAAQLESWIDSLPEGIDSYVGERGGKVSGGQAQRIAIARAIAKDAPIILLDEPTSALDDETAKAVMLALENLTKGKTVVHVTHRDHTLWDYDCVYDLRGGKLYDTKSKSSI
ncbi:ATP-binding cassette domain-containing protein, partial [Anaerosporobacter sp.]|uniref:ATP-binding cassette domain-containing protein n=1 Tax=Anaerosporobacter sp. TaxID=1872529 RepID=UPI0028A06E51